MPLVLVPLVGPFHLRFPRYDVVTVRETVARARPAALATTALHDRSELDDPSWQDLEEPALTMELVPWARRAGVAIEPCGVPSLDPEAAASFDRIVGESEAGRAALASIEPTREALREILSGALDLAGVTGPLTEAVAAYQEARRAAFGPGPGTDWIEERGEAMARRLVEVAERHAPASVAAAIPVDHLPRLRVHLADRGDLLVREPEPVPPSDEARARALRDVALSGRYDDPGALLRGLREQEGPEARWVEAEVLLRHGHPAEALDVLRDASRGDFSHPPQLPGWLLARLGQLYDLDGRRDDALRAYRGALALSWVPRAAREAARDGLERPFQPPDADGSDRDRAD